MRENWIDWLVGLLSGYGFGCFVTGYQYQKIITGYRELLYRVTDGRLGSAPNLFGPRSFWEYPVFWWARVVVGFQCWRFARAKRKGKKP